MATVRIDGVEYDSGALEEDAQRILQSIIFTEQGLQRLRNELAIADTARIAYGESLKREFSKKKDVKKTTSKAKPKSKKKGG